MKSNNQTEKKLIILLCDENDYYGIENFRIIDNTLSYLIKHKITDMENTYCMLIGTEGNFYFSLDHIDVQNYKQEEQSGLKQFLKTLNKQKFEALTEHSVDYAIICGAPDQKFTEEMGNCLMGMLDNFMIESDGTVRIQICKYTNTNIEKYIPSQCIVSIPQGFSYISKKNMGAFDMGTPETSPMKFKSSVVHFKNLLNHKVARKLFANNENIVSNESIIKQQLIETYNKSAANYQKNSYKGYFLIDNLSFFNGKQSIPLDDLLEETKHDYLVKQLKRFPGKIKDLNIKEAIEALSLAILMHNNNNDMLQLIKMLIENHKEIIDKKNKFGIPPLFLAAGLSSSYSIVEYLLSHDDIDVNISIENIESLSDSDGNTPIFHAVKEKNSDIVKLLLEHKKLDVTIVNNFGLTCLNTLIESKLYDHALTVFNMKKIDYSLKASNGCTYLHFAAYYDHLELTHKLLEENVIDVNAKNDSSLTALHFAILAGNHEIAEVLLGLPNIIESIACVSEDNQTPLDIAEEMQFETLVTKMKEILEKNNDCIGVLPRYSYKN